MPTLEEVMDKDDSREGYCINCKDWTHDSCDPDSRKVKCPECGERTVYGVEELIFMGLVE